MKRLLVALLTVFSITACQKDETPAPQGNNDLVGTWINPQYTDTLLTYTRAASLVENEVGYIFKEGNTLICRQNSGWCGTPPIVTADYNGTWSWSDSIVSIKTSYWGGTTEFTWKVISLDQQKLVVTVLNYNNSGK